MEAFKPYYKATVIEKVTDPNNLYNYEKVLDEYGVYHKEELEKFSTIYYKTKKSTDDIAKLNSIIDVGATRYSRIEEEEKLDDFKSRSKKFVRLYAFVTQITPFVDVELHKLFLYLSYLIKKLIADSPTSPPDLSDIVSLEYYSIEQQPSVELVLEPDVLYTPDGEGGKKEDEEEQLSSIIDRINERFGTDFTESEKLSIEQIKEDFANDKVLVLKAKTNDIDDFRLAYDKAFMDKVVDRIRNNDKFFARILDDEEFRVALMDEMLNETYKRLRQEAT